MKQRRRMRASFVQTLVYYDGPVLALLQNRKGSNVLAYVIREDIEGYSEPYIAKLTNEKILADYLEQRVDLSYLMRAKGGEPYLFDWANFDDEVVMVPAEEVIENIEDVLPPAGIFSRNHTEAIKGLTVTSLVSHAFKIDGRWSANDFSRFYSKLADLYSLFSYLDEMRDSTGPLAQKLVDKIAKYPWQRGGSYLGFFRDIASESRDEYPLQVSKIKYASPGQIEVKGVKSSLDHIDSLVLTFDKLKPGLSTTYQELRGILERDGVLGSDDKDFSLRPVANSAKERADKLLSSMGVADTDAVLTACQNHLVTYSKIAMAIYRRGEEFHKFHAEGRMQLPS